MLRSDFFSAEDAHPLALGAACDLLLGDGWLTWELRTTRDELRMLGYETNERNCQKIAAYNCARTTIGPWADWEIFENIGHGFTDGIPNFELRQPLDVAECAITVECLRLCRIVTFTEDVKRYIAACGATDEFLYLPEPLTFAMPYLCPQMYTCLEHGGRDIDDLIDGRCDLCVGRYEDGDIRDAPLPELQHRGAQIQRYSLYDYAQISTRYEALAAADLDTVQVELSEEGIQLAKLLDVNSRRRRVRAQYDAQIREVREYAAQQQ